MPPIVAIIVAVGPEGIIGADNQMPWHLPRDMRFFRKATQGHTVIMGRKTFESLGRRPLPKRRNIVITRNPRYEAAGIELAGSLETAVARCGTESRVFIIGGGDVYRQAMDIADEILVTEIRDFNPNLELFPTFVGDTYFPEIQGTKWRLARPGKRWLIAANTLQPLPAGKLKRSGMYFRFMKYLRDN